MASLDATAFPYVELGLASRSRVGETASGDRALVRALGAGALLAVIDGLGHGDAAATAAEAAVAALEDAPADSRLHDLLERCHRRVRKTRGVVLSLALVEPERETLSWAGVGDVEAVLVRASGRRETLALRPGVVGQRLPPYRPTAVPLAAGDTLVLATDGLRRGVAGGVAPAASAVDAAQRLLDVGAEDDDDALVLVARYLGGGGSCR